MYASLSFQKTFGEFVSHFSIYIRTEPLLKSMVFSFDRIISIESEQDLYFDVHTTQANDFLSARAYEELLAAI